MSLNSRKGSNGECRCCGATKKCRVLNVAYEWKGEREVYSDMFVDCFGLLLSNLDCNTTKRLICPTCVVRLRDANAFRQQVLQSEEKLHNAIVLLDDEESLRTDIKCEIECDLEEDSREASDMELDDRITDPLEEAIEKKMNKQADTMPYKIVKIIQNGKFVLIPVPELWEKDGVIHWPASSRKKPEGCIVQRSNLSSLEEAEQEIERMSPRPSAINRLHDEDDSQTISNQDRIFEITLEPSNTANSLKQTRNSAPHNLESTLVDISTKLQSIIANQIVLQKNQQNISTEVIKMRENQQNIFLEIAKTNLNLEECIKGVLSRDTSIDGGNNIDFKPIENDIELSELESNLGDPEYRIRLENFFSAVCAKQEGKGLNAAYRLVDMIFSRRFLVHCSWAGGSRGEDSKICFRAYKKIIEFFFKLVKASDSLFTLEDCETFFKAILRNSTKRSMLLNVRQSGMKNRPKKIKLDKQERANNSDDIVIE